MQLDRLTNFNRPNFVTLIWSAGQLGEFEASLLKQIAIKKHLAKRLKAIAARQGRLLMTEEGESGIWRNAPVGTAAHAETAIREVQAIAAEILVPTGVEELSDCPNLGLHPCGYIEIGANDVDEKSTEAEKQSEDGTAGDDLSKVRREI